MKPIRNLAALQSDNVVVNMAALEVSDAPQGVIVTYALGSCIAVCIHDPVRQAAGMIHYMLPLAKVSPDKAANVPAMFADTGVPLLFDKMFALGCQKGDLVIKVIGGGVFQDDRGLFNIGKRNYTVLRKLFWRNNLIIAAEDVGGRKSRTVRMYVNDGRVVVSSQGQDAEL